jgi:hypothetical protein
MPDLSPNLSIYPKPQQQSPGDLLSLFRGIQGYQSQQSLSDALKSSGGDPDAARAQLLSSGNGNWVTPEQLGALTSQAKALFDFKADQMGKVQGAMSSMITKAGTREGATLETWAPLKIALKKVGVPDDMISAMEQEAVGPDGRFKPKVLATMWNAATGNQGLPTVKTYDPTTGEPGETAAGQILQEGAATAGRGGGAGGRFGLGGYGTALPPQEAAQREIAGKESTAMLSAENAKRIAGTRSSLSQLDALSEEAASGPAADFSKRWSNLVREAGLPELATMTPNMVAAGENFDKIANRLVSQMQEGSAHTNEWRQTYLGSNPSLVQSRLGRSGIIHWLQGNNDVENLIATRWQKWLSMPEHAGMQGQFQNWLRTMPDGMHIANLDPRVFQYERMTADEQAQFRKMLKPGELGEFHRTLQRYERDGWLKDAKGGTY